MSKEKGRGKLFASLASFGNTIKRLFVFGRKKSQLSLLEEEAIMSPTRTIVRNFFSNKLAIIGLVGFIAIMLFTFGGSALNPVDLYDTSLVLQNVKPGKGYLNVPKKLQQEGIKDMSTGITFSVALSNEGNLYVWGVDVRGVLSIPKEIQHENIVKVAAGDRHIIVLTGGGKIYGWGYNNFDQTSLPFEYQGLLMLENVVDIKAGDLYSVIVTDAGKMYVWGAVLANRLDVIPSRYQGNIKEVKTTSYNVLLLLNDNTIGITGPGNNAISKIPEYLTDGSVHVDQIAIAMANGAAIDDQGFVYAWGDNQFKLNQVPEELASLANPNGVKAKAIASGRGHFVVLDVDGKLHAWGTNRYNQSTLPKGAENEIFEYISAGFNQSFAVTKEGKVYSWGNNGFIWGTDDYGRDIFIRLMHGGRVTMLVGAIAVVISTVLGVLVGLISGFYGGWIDNALMRFAEIINSFPFLPLAVTLSSFMAEYLNQTQRIGMIMIILGVISWPGLARLVRGQILAEREKDFVLAAQALGIRPNKVIFRHILPNVINVIIVSMTLAYAGSLLTEAGLSFLGFGVVPPSPSWGNMLTGAQKSQVIQMYWWRWVIPALAVLLAALSINLIGDGLREAMDPKTNEK